MLTLLPYAALFYFVLCRHCAARQIVEGIVEGSAKREAGVAGALALKPGALALKPGRLVWE